MNNNNECDMSLELLVLDKIKVALCVPYVPNCKESFKLNIDTYLKDLTEKDYLVIWESEHDKYIRIALSICIRQGKYILNKLVMCNERYEEDREEK